MLIPRKIPIGLLKIRFRVGYWWNGKKQAAACKKAMAQLAAFERIHPDLDDYAEVMAELINQKKAHSLGEAYSLAKSRLQEGFVNETTRSAEGMVDSKYPRPDWVPESFRVMSCGDGCEMQDTAWIPAPDGAYSIGLQCAKCGKAGGVTIKPLPGMSQVFGPTQGELSGEMTIVAASPEYLTDCDDLTKLCGL